MKLNPIICLIVDSLMEEEGELGLVEKGISISKLICWTRYTGDSKRKNGADGTGKGAWWKGLV